MHLDFHFCSRIVVHLLSLYLSLVDGFEDGVDKRGGGLRERYLADDYGLRVELLYLSPHLHHASTLTVVVSCHVNGSACGEVREELEVLSAQVMYGGVADFHEVMRQNLRAEAHGNALRALCKKEREFGRKRDRLLVSSVVRELPESGFGIENHVERKLRESCLDVTRCSSAVTGEYVTPVTLTVHQQILLTHLHESVADGSVAVRVELHGVSHDVSHLVEATVVHALHRV